MIRAETREALNRAGLNVDDVLRMIDVAIAEDLGGGVDVTTSATVPPDQHASMDLVARQRGVVAGVPVAAAVFEVTARAPEAAVVMCVTDGNRVAVGDVVLSATGLTADLLVAERTALNLLGRLSGVATLTRMWVDALAGTPTRVRDTRKTTPSLRFLEKYAVRCGGGVNHRMSLADAALIKDNHVLAAGGAARAFRNVRRRFPDVPIEIEVDSLEQLGEAVEAGADMVLLDNFDIDELRAAVAWVSTRVEADGVGLVRRPALEASGGLRLADAFAIGSTGVDFVAIGAITHSAPSLDVGGDLRDVGL